jgi:hypothetical protein
VRNSHLIGASYGGDSTHSASGGSTTVVARERQRGDDD